MYKIYFSEIFEYEIKKFLGYLKNYYFGLYSETGIFNESEILDNYDKKFNELYFEIRDNIEKQAKIGLLGKKNLRENKEYILCSNGFKLKSYFFTFESKKYIKDAVIIIDSLSYRGIR